MTTKRVDLKDFIRNLANNLPKNRDRKAPIICLEFKGGHSTDFGSRIAIYRIESLKILWYRFVEKYSGDDEKTLKEWTVDDEYWRVVNIVPPKLIERTKGDSSLATIQVVQYHA